MRQQVVRENDVYFDKKRRNVLLPL